LIHDKKPRIRPRVQGIRHIVQAGFFVLIALISVSKFAAENGVTLPFLSEASLHTLCPFGGVVSVYRYVTEGALVQKIHESAFVLMVLVFLLSFLFGPVFCGWFCPFGSLQEWLGKLGKRVLGKRFNHVIPAALDHVLRYLRYILLALVVYMTAKTATLTFQNIDPYYALFNFFTGEVAPAALAVLAVVLLSSLVVERPWCKYACPYGALLGLTNLLRVFGIRRRESSCIGCKACDRACPMNIQVSTASKVRNHQCISCMKCTSESACPIGNTVNLSVKEGN
jgi:polyferredoxin